MENEQGFASLTGLFLTFTAFILAAAVYASAAAALSGTHEMALEQRLRLFAESSLEAAAADIEDDPSSADGIGNTPVKRSEDETTQSGRRLCVNVYAVKTADGLKLLAEAWEPSTRGSVSSVVCLRREAEGYRVDHWEMR